MMLRRLFAALALIACVLLGFGESPRAQSPATAAASPAQAIPAPVSVDELQRLVETLNDANERAKLVGQLQALVAAQHGLDENTAAERPGTWLNRLSNQIDAVSAEIVTVAGVVLDAPSWIDWLRQQARDAQLRGLWLGIGLNLIVVFGIAIVAQWILRLLLRRPQSRLCASRRRC
jgi:hypothetical protein